MRALNITDPMRGGTLAGAATQRGGASLAALEKLRSSAPLAEATSCAVCMEAISAGRGGLQLPCGHVFHSACVLPWLQEGSGTCPCCRQPLE